MNTPYDQTNLYLWLHKRDAGLASRVSDARNEISHWLPHILTLYPHYPQHGIEHSDRIVAQLSHLLFSKGKPTCEFTKSEAYCLLCAIYIHDSGMVVSPAQLLEIFGTVEWTDYLASIQATSEKIEYDKIRTAIKGPNDDKTTFLAAVALKKIAAEFIRRRHHYLGKTAIELHPFLKNLLDYGDPVAFSTIADIAIGHGLQSAQLSDQIKYPDARIVFGNPVNVRFLARLLRIGDLLDLDVDRASPISESAVLPLPSTAIPHWKQYSAKRHENITPEVIEYRFECQDQESHRVLRDWFGWLCSEIHDVAIEQLHSARQNGWVPPTCEVASCKAPDENQASGATIIIKPAKGAKYRFFDWKLSIDHAQVLNYFIYDIYGDATVFVRELLQNALDATRCALYSAHRNTGRGRLPPEYPTGFSHSTRKKYPVLIRLSRMSPGKPDSRWLFEIEDHGIGMDENIITKYFLQIGKSYYQSSDFREQFKFSPTSRFGVGFLSVFAVATRVTVETCRMGVHSGIRLQLEGPRSYLLTEDWTPFPERKPEQRHGTRIQLILDEEIDATMLLNYVRRICVAVEVPIHVEIPSEKRTLTCAPAIDNVKLARSSRDPEAYFVRHVFPVVYPGIEGYVSLTAYVDQQGEGWADCWSQKRSLDGNRIDALPRPPQEFLAYHGLLVSEHFKHDRSVPQWTAHIDVRSSAAVVPIARKGFRRNESFIKGSSTDQGDVHKLANDAISASVESAVSQHLATTKRIKSPRGFYYLGKVLSHAPVSKTWRNSYPGTCISWRDGEKLPMSADEVFNLETFQLAYWNPNSKLFDRTPGPPKVFPKTVKTGLPIFSPADFPAFVDSQMEEHIKAFCFSDLRIFDDLWLITFSRIPNTNIRRIYPTANWWLWDFSAEIISVIVARRHRNNDWWFIVNRQHPIVKWALNLEKAVERHEPWLTESMVSAVWRDLAVSGYSWRDLIAKWNAAEDVPAAFKPGPDIGNSTPLLGEQELITRQTILR